jgi:hypothetical protein
MEFNFVPARYRNSKISKAEFRTGVEFRASSKIKIQTCQNLNLKLKLTFEQTQLIWYYMNGYLHALPAQMLHDLLH